MGDKEGLATPAEGTPLPHHCSPIPTKAVKSFKETKSRRASRLRWGPRTAPPTSSLRKAYVNILGDENVIRGNSPQSAPTRSLVMHGVFILRCRRTCRTIIHANWRQDEADPWACRFSEESSAGIKHGVRKINNRHRTTRMAMDWPIRKVLNRIRAIRSRKISKRKSPRWKLMAQLLPSSGPARNSNTAGQASKFKKVLTRARWRPR